MPYRRYRYLLSNDQVRRFPKRCSTASIDGSIHDRKSKTKNATPHPLSHEVEDLVNKSEKRYFFDLQDREDIVRDALKVIDLVYQSKIGLTEVALSEFTKAGEEITRVFVEGGVLSDWNFELVNGLGDQDNELFTIDSDGFVRARANQINV